MKTDWSPVMNMFQAPALGRILVLTAYDMLICLLYLIATEFLLKILQQHSPDSGSGFKANRRFILMLLHSIIFSV